MGEEPEYKQVIVVRDDLRLSRGKLAVQVAHASISAYEKAEKKIILEWKKRGQKKVVVRVNNLEELTNIANQAEKMGLPVSIVRDAGLTEVPPGTITAVGIGPEKGSRIDKITGNLPLLK